MWRGSLVAVVTPFRDGAIDEEAVRRLVDLHVCEGTDALVPVGTTGESPTLSHPEHDRVIDLFVRVADGRIPVIAGTGSNSTEEALRMSLHAREAGADGLLQVVPYYNKPPQRGLYEHFALLAAEVDLPQIVYNIPGRCGVEIQCDTIDRLASEFPNIVAVKEASGDLNRVSRFVAGGKVAVLSGDDSLTVPMMSIGAVGVISVAANVVPGALREMTHAMLSGDLAGASRLHGRLFPLFRDLFLETNPIPVKAALAMKGMIREELRLPLVPMAEEPRRRLEQTLRDLGEL